MVLDVICIIISYLLRNINSKTANQMKEIIVRRYINLDKESVPVENAVYSIFTDSEAMRIIDERQRKAKSNGSATNSFVV